MLLIGDKVYDSDGLDEKLFSEYGLEIIAPHPGGPLSHANPRRPVIAPLSETLGDRAAFCMAADFPPSPDAFRL